MCRPRRRKWSVRTTGPGTAPSETAQRRRRRLLRMMSPTRTNISLPERSQQTLSGSTWALLWWWEVNCARRTETDRAPNTSRVALTHIYKTNVVAVWTQGTHLGHAPHKTLMKYTLERKFSCIMMIVHSFKCIYTQALQQTHTHTGQRSSLVYLL